jgi:hypothetical protein
LPIAPKLKPTADDFLTIIRRQQLGKLKIYLGPRLGVAHAASLPQPELI